MRYQRTQASREAYLGWWDEELRRWGQEKATAVPVTAMQRAQKAITSWFGNRAKLERKADPGIQKEPDKKEAQEEPKKALKQKVIEDYNLLEPPREGVQRVWTDGSQQTGVDGRQCAGYGAWFGEGHARNFSAPLQGNLQTNNRADLTAAIEVLKIAPQTTELQLCVDSQLVTDGATLWLEGWRRRGWKTKKGRKIKNIDLWQELYEVLQQSRAAQELVKVPSLVAL